MSKNKEESKKKEKKKEEIEELDISDNTLEFTEASVFSQFVIDKVTENKELKHWKVVKDSFARSINNRKFSINFQVKFHDNVKWNRQKIFEEGAKLLQTIEKSIEEQKFWNIEKFACGNIKSGCGMNVKFSLANKEQRELILEEEKNRKITDWTDKEKEKQLANINLEMNNEEIDDVE